MNKMNLMKMELRMKAWKREEQVHWMGPNGVKAFSHGHGHRESYLQSLQSQS